MVSVPFSYPVNLIKQSPLFSSSNCSWTFLDARIEVDLSYDPNFVPWRQDIPSLLKKGLLLVDKPAGPTSHEVVYHIKQILEIKKAGHHGTLDPNVTGVLAVGLGKGTRALQVLAESEKEYVAILQLHGEVDSEAIKSCFHEFQAKIYQRPPLKSSVKRRLRVRAIYHLDILEINHPYILFRVRCQAGTYIRKLCTDIGEALGCGAHMKQLRRVASGPFSEKSGIYTLQNLMDASYYYYNEDDDQLLRSILLPIEYTCLDIHKIIVRDNTIQTISRGVPLGINGIIQYCVPSDYTGMVALFSVHQELVALAHLATSPANWMNSSKTSQKTVAFPKKVFVET